MSGYGSFREQVQRQRKTRQDNANLKEVIMSEMFAGIMAVSGRGSITWRLSLKVDEVKYRVCRACFSHMYMIGLRTFESWSPRVKAKWLNKNDHLGMARFDRGVSAEPYGTHFESIYHALSFADQHREMKYTFEILQMMCVPDTPLAWHLFRWFKIRFEYCGEHDPTNADHIQIDSTYTKASLRAIYNENCQDIGYPEYQVCESYFNACWFKWFGRYVTITQTKSVEGKCHECFTLKYFLRHIGCLTMREREYAKALRVHHSLKTKMARKVYADTKNAAIENPTKKQSWVLDGMTKNKTKVPQCGDLGCIKAQLALHLEGAIVHGKGKFAFIDFEHQSTSNSNKLIESLVCLVEKSKDEQTGFYPEEVHSQFDGGSENANQFVLAFITYLVAIGVYGRFIYTRSISGHGHNDDDAFFSTIAKKLENTVDVPTLQKFYECVETCCPGQTGAISWQNKVEVVPLYVVGNYKDFFAGCTDDHPTNFHKGESTVHQWEFVRVPVDDAHPVGVATFYKHQPFDDVPLLSGGEQVAWQARHTSLAVPSVDRTIEALDLQPSTSKPVRKGKGKKTPLTLEEKAREEAKKLKEKFRKEHRALIDFRKLKDKGDSNDARNNNKLSILDIERIWVVSERKELKGGFLTQLPPVDRVLKVDEFTTDKDRAHSFSKAQQAIQERFGTESESAKLWAAMSPNFPPPPPRKQKKRKSKHDNDEELQEEEKQPEGKARARKHYRNTHTFTFITHMLTKRTLSHSTYNAKVILQAIHIRGWRTKRTCGSLPLFLLKKLVKFTRWVQSRTVQNQFRFLLCPWLEISRTAIRLLLAATTSRQLLLEMRSRPSC